LPPSDAHLARLQLNIRTQYRASFFGGIASLKELCV